VERLAKGWGGVLTLYVRDGEGDLADATGAVTVVVRDAAGATVASGTATKTPATTGTYTFACTAAQLADLGSYTATWTATVGGVGIAPVTEVEVVGGHLFGVDELRARRAEFSDTTKYPPGLLVDKRLEVTEWLEALMQVALVPRRRRLATRGDGTDRILTGDPLISGVVSVTVDGDAWDVADLAGDLDIGEVVAPPGSVWTKDAPIVLVYDHGYPSVPAKVKDAALDVAVDATLPSALNPRATVQNTDLGAFRLSIPTPGTPTGIPEVDQVIRTYGYRRPAV
jgi:hypothetical protein